MGPLHAELPEELSTRLLPLTPAGKSEPVWEMEMLLQEKEMGQAGEWGDTEQSQGCVFRGRRAKKGNN